MELRFASRMKDYEEGIFQVLNEKKEELVREGRTVYNLSVGTPDFQPQQAIMDAVAEAARKPENYKYALRDLPELTEAVISVIKKVWVELEPDEIMSVYGSQEGIAHIGLSLCDREDIVLVPDPGYPIFAIGPSLAGARLMTYDLTEENHYLPDLEALGGLADKAKFMIVSYPMNPICKCAPHSFYEELIPWAKKHELIIIHDNAYSDIIYDGRKGISILSIPGAKEVCVEFYSLSKSFNYTGARMGFLTGNRELVQNFKKLRSQIDYGTFLPVQYGAIAALTGPDEPVLKQCEEYRKRRDALCGGFRSIGWNVPDSEGPCLPGRPFRRALKMIRHSSWSLWKRQAFYVPRQQLRRVGKRACTLCPDASCGDDYRSGGGREGKRNFGKITKKQKSPARC